jgi:hypothetical protein
MSCAASSSFSRLGPSRVIFPLLSLRNSMKAIGYSYKTSGSASSTIQEYPFLGHNQLETRYDSSFLGERMKCSHRRTSLEAKFGMPRRGMGSIARNVEFDFVVCLQYLTRFCVAWKLSHENEPIPYGVGEKKSGAYRGAGHGNFTSNTNHASPGRLSKHFIYLRS